VVPKDVWRVLGYSGMVKRVSESDTNGFGHIRKYPKDLELFRKFSREFEIFPKVGRVRKGKYPMGTMGLTRLAHKEDGDSPWWTLLP
jgi:hypothetical protein